MIPEPFWFQAVLDANIDFNTHGAERQLVDVITEATLADKPMLTVFMDDIICESQEQLTDALHGMLISNSTATSGAIAAIAMSKMVGEARQLIHAHLMENIGDLFDEVHFRLAEEAELSEGDRKITNRNEDEVAA